MCANLATDRALQGYCIEHRGEFEKKRRKHQRVSRQRRQDNTQQAKLDAFYRTAAWRKCRNAYIAKQPLCEHCATAGTIKPADVVDHIVERKDGGDNYNHNNLQSLCHGCHNTKTQEERRIRHGRTG